MFTGFLLRRRASYCEIYNEALYDLLKFTKQQLQVSWTSPQALQLAWQAQSRSCLWPAAVQYPAGVACNKTCNSTVTGSI